MLLVSLCLAGCSTHLQDTETTEDSNLTIHYEATNDVQSYKFAKPDGDYSEIKVDKATDITSERIAQTFNNFWMLEKTDKKIDTTVDILEEDVLTYKDRTCNYIFYTNGLVAYSDTKGNKEVLEWKSNYVK